MEPGTRQQLTDDNWGYCPNHLIKKLDDCQDTYDRVEDVCVRVSPAPLKWADAESKCVEEGGHLLHVLSQGVQDGVQKLIKYKLKMKDFFSMDKWSTGLSSEHEKYWTGGSVFKQDEWKWNGNRLNMSSFSNWEKGSEGEGCNPACYDFHGLTINTRAQYKWRAEPKDKAFPYICLSDCRIGCLWQRNSRRCVCKGAEPAGQAAASVLCAEDGGRLLSLDSCQEMAGLQADLWLSNPSLTEEYWVGQFLRGMHNYVGQRRTSNPKDGNLNSRGQLGLQGGVSANTCADPRKIVFSGQGASLSGYHGRFSFVTAPDATGAAETAKAEIKLTEFLKTESVEEKNFLCEQESDWTCPEGFIGFQEICYQFHAEAVTLGTADRECSKMGGRVAEVETRLHAVFLTAWLQQYNITTVWLGHRRHNSTTEYLSMTDDVWDTSSGLQVADFKATSPTYTDLLTEDCLVMDSAEGDHNGWRTAACDSTSAYVCQVRQELSREKVLGIPALPEVLMPLDLVTGFTDYHMEKREVNASRVAITYSISPGNGLRGAAHFDGTHSSHIQIGSTTDEDKIISKYGITFSAWVYIDDIIATDRHFLLDASGPCEEGTEKYNGFMLWIELSPVRASGTAAPVPEACGAITNNNPRTSGGYIMITAKLCDGPVVNEGPVTAGTCSIFQSANSMPLTPQKWEYVGFSYDPITKKGTFIVNQLHGYQGVSSQENKYFLFDSKQWLSEGGKGFEGPLRIGGMKHIKEDSSSTGLLGKLSCMQLWGQGLSAAQVQHLASCPLDPAYMRSSLCPFGYQLFKEGCYRISSREKTFSEAEVDCSSGNGHGRLAFPSDYRLVEFLAQMAKERDGVVQSWVGLDGRSDPATPIYGVNPVWTRSDGELPDHIRWADGFPSSDLTQQCVLMDHASGG